MLARPDALTRYINRRPRLSVHLLLGLAALALMIHAFAAPLENAGPDGEKYERMGYAAAEAPSLFACDNFARAYWTPGWIATIGALYKLTGRSPQAIRLLLILLALATAWLSSGIARRLSGPVAAVIAPALFLFSNLIFRFTTFFQYEVLLTFLVVLAGVLIFGFVKPPGFIRGLTAGLVLGGAALVSPRVLVFAPLLALLNGISSWYRTIRTCAAMAFGILIVLTPWTLRNYHCFGEFLPLTSSGGINLYIGNNPHSTGGYHLPERGMRPEIPFSDHRAWTRSALAYMAGHPARTLGRMLVKAGSFWTPHYGDQYFLLLLFVLAWIRFLRSRPPLSPEIAWVLSAPFAMMLLHTLFFVQPRYVIPVLPFVCVVAATAIGGWRDRSDEEKKNAAECNWVHSAT